MDQASSDPIVEVTLERMYGNERFYPCNHTSELICKLLDQKSITKKQLKICRDYGWKVLIKMQEYELE